MKNVCITAIAIGILGLEKNLPKHNSKIFVLKMFYEQEKINQIGNCSRCLETLDEPRILPCGETVCSRCLSFIYVENKKFNCIMCSKQHTMPDEGLPLNKTVLNLLSIQPSQVYRSHSVEELKQTLDIMLKKITQMHYSLDHGVDKIKEQCIELKKDVQLATEEAIQQLIICSDEMLKEIDQFEADTRKAYTQTENTNHLKEMVDEISKKLKSFHSECTEYLKQAQINDQEILNAKKHAAILNEKAELGEFYLNNFIFNGCTPRFTFNRNKLERNLLGSLDLEGIKSNILSPQLMMQLIRLCEFPLEKKWKLLYRASEHSFGVGQFHARCDRKPNTLVIIKSTNGNVFGGYTEQDWSGNSYKNDLNAFIFSFANKENRPLVMKCEWPENAIFASVNYGPTFGLGADIYICSNSNVNNGSYSNLGKSYKHPDYAFESNEAKGFLAETCQFRTIEIEVYTKLN